MKNIKTKGQSDKQIADQIMKQIDGLTSTTSDDILKSMLEQATNKEDLLKQFYLHVWGKMKRLLLRND